ncbi:Extradiol ring-cleavage dioxygenase, class III enzyme, subunit B [Cantharellus anzutake]|uniref:Extradiol ring-cleavage dioxygenase, class III enzyme, subunit B n=1 Tax=Cantharellus anzutake TaxID=1750568 RepID=UPI0019070BC4|nr:Extradiol ring-cleavage dioxygenase, class III enzyme, subunit B [Cantharellus anzutake]KAF8338135.1 Extradiol ring-cleavage dioxygenase, class III enzyme, subunit B [Cantharellus anzutake]
MSLTDTPKTREQCRAALESLPDTPDRIPAIFLAHGPDAYLAPKPPIPSDPFKGPIFNWAGREGPLAQFLDDLGPLLLKKYKPKGIIVHRLWERKPLLMDYYGFSPELYQVEFISRGDSVLTQKIVNAFIAAGIPARPIQITEPRGHDGRGYDGPGLDHGVFMPEDIPVVEVSIDESLSTEKHWEIGRALRIKVCYLIISGGLVIHSFKNNGASFNPERAGPVLHDFHDAITQAVLIKDPAARREALHALTNHQGFRVANPREEHFIPLYVAAGAGDTLTGEDKDGETRILADFYGMSSFAFGL